MEDQKELSFSGTGCLARLYWMFFGNVLLFVLLTLVFQKRSTLPFLLDAAYLVAVASLIVVRYIDIRFLNGQTGEGKPATMTHWRRYALSVAAVAGGVWLLARAFYAS